MNKSLSKITTISFNSWGEFFTSPAIIGLSQAHPLIAGIVGFFGGAYSQQQYETMNDFLHLLHAKVKNIEDRYIDKDFFNTPDGKRILGKTLRSILRDNRMEKLQAMANLTINLHIKSKLSIDEKELYVDILDGLNSLQLSILQKVVQDMRSLAVNKHRGLGWELLADQYAQKGISKPLVLQSIRTLESNGLVNQNTAQLQEKDKTHFVTDFGEQFCDFVSDILKENSPYL